MIKVLKKTFDILELLGDGEGLPLETLAEKLAMNKGTLCNILKTMIALRLVARSTRGTYRRVVKIVPIDNKPQLPEWSRILIDQTVEKTASVIGESIVAATLRGAEVVILSQRQPERQLIINSGIFYANLSLYHSVTGRILAGYASADDRVVLASKAGLPRGNWENASTPEEFEKLCFQIRERGISIMENRADGIKSFAVPVCDKEGGIMLALAMTMPLFRLKDEDGIIHQLKHGAETLQNALCSGGLVSTDFFCV